MGAIRRNQKKKKKQEILYNLYKIRRAYQLKPDVLHGWKDAKNTSIFKRITVSVWLQGHLEYVQIIKH